MLRHLMKWQGLGLNFTPESHARSQVQGKSPDSKMVRGSVSLLKCAAAGGFTATLADILVCPLSKQPLRLCLKTNSLISDSIGVSYPIIDGIPRLVPTDAKIIDVDDSSSFEYAKGSPEINSPAEK